MTQVIIDSKAFEDQAGAVATAMSEVDENSASSLQRFINRMLILGVLIIR